MKKIELILYGVLIQADLSKSLGVKIKMSFHLLYQFFILLHLLVYFQAKSDMNFISRCESWYIAFL